MKKKKIRQDDRNLKELDDEEFLDVRQEVIPVDGIDNRSIRRVHVRTDATMVPPLPARKRGIDFTRSLIRSCF